MCPCRVLCSSSGGEAREGGGDQARKGHRQARLGSQACFHDLAHPPRGGGSCGRGGGQRRVQLSARRGGGRTPALAPAHAPASLAWPPRGGGHQLYVGRPQCHGSSSQREWEWCSSQRHGQGWWWWRWGRVGECGIIQPV